MTQTNFKKTTIGMIEINTNNFISADTFLCCICGLLNFLAKYSSIYGLYYKDYNLAGKEYFMKDGKIYCEKDYEKIFAPFCNTCNHAIHEDQYISANEKNYHIEHFSCAKCKMQFLGQF